LNTEPQTSVNFERALRVVRRRGPIVLLCLVIAAGSAYAFAKHQTKKYTASATLLFQQDQLLNQTVGLGNGVPQQQQFSQSQQDTNIQLATLGDVSEKTAAQLGPHWTKGLVRSMISASPDGDTNLVYIQATASSPLVAQKVANTYAAVFATEQQQQEVAQVVSYERYVNEQLAAMSPQQRDSSSGIDLANRAQQLALLAKLATGNVQVVGQAGVPRSPSAPKTSRDVILGAILGLLIGLMIAFVLERLDRRIRDAKELEEAYGLPLLATVPQRDDYEVMTTLGQSKDSGRLTLYDEVFNLLRSYLRYFSVDRELRTLLVISAHPNEGKTTVCYNLAKAAAALGSRVLLVEGDLRHGSVMAPLVDRPDPALPDVLIGEATMEEAIRTVQIGTRGQLDVLIAGAIPPPNTGELIESHAMETLINRAAASYDLVVIDTPPLTLVADAIPLLNKVDGVLVVGRVGVCRRDAAEHLRTKLESLRVPVLGVIANGAGAEERRRYGYGYGYGYGYQYADTKTAETASTNGSDLGEVPQDVARIR